MKIWPTAMPLHNNSIRCLFPYKNFFIKWANPVSARAYKIDHTIDLLSGRARPGGVAELFSSLKREELNGSRRRPKAIYLFYELGHIFQGLEECLKGDETMGLEIEFDSIQKIALKNKDQIESLRLKALSEQSRESYEQKFIQGRAHLKNGDCYQYNLTAPFYFSLEGPHCPELEDLASLLWREQEFIGSYGNLTDLGPHCPAGRFLLSNSPECLFQVCALKNGGYRLETMPIKGTIALSDSVTKSWQRLQDSSKDESELFMIVDLLRNDLSAIGEEFSFVVKKKTPLVAKGLVHQYAKIALDSKRAFNLFSVVKNIFPGGSITGAPKKRVMQILNKLEFPGRRGFYCGSTILLHKSLQAASINIRSAVYKRATLECQAGGGITLKSDLESEYREMILKLDSFLELLA